MTHRLKIELPGLARIHYALRGEGPWRIGSGEACDIPVKARGVSRNHLELTRTAKDEVAFRDLGSTNGTRMDGVSVTRGVLATGGVLQIGEVLLALEDTGTDEIVCDPALGAVSISSTIDLNVLSGHLSSGSAGGRIPFISLVSLMEEAARGENLGQHWRTLTRLFSEAFGCLSAKCYRLQEDGLTLQATEGDFPNESLPPSLAQACARLPKTVTFETPDGSGGTISALSVPIHLQGFRVVFIGVLPGGEDVVSTRMDKLLMIPVLFRFILQWLGELEQKAATIDLLKREIHSARASGGRSPHGVEPILGRDEKLLSAIELADRVSPTDLSILLTGPTGTGKELFARRIHALSDRASKPMLTVNCSSIPENLLESELFGAKRGAYTGSYESRKGYFEAADGGTLFLDEISDMPLSLQPKLLRVLEEKKVTPVGNTRPQSIDVRILAATNQDIKKLMSKGAFRPDLYYRLTGMTVSLPALKDRNGDVALLASAFLERANREFKRSILGFEEEAINLIDAYEWPGNVRELQAVVKRLVLTTQEPIISAVLVRSALRMENFDIPALFSGAWDMPWHKAKETFEKEFFLRRLKGSKEPASKLAAELQISRPSLYLKLKKLGMSPDKRSDLK